MLDKLFSPRRLIRGLVAGLAAALTLCGAASAKPLVAILADARGTVATDLLAPYAILAESGAVEVKVVSATSAPVRLMPGYAWVAPQMTLAQLEQRRPDVIIVPALHVEDDPATAEWLRAQARRGVRLMSICNGARVLGEAGLLDGRQATVHWYSRRYVAKNFPKAGWRYDVRWITDGPITTTAGISAGEPATLDLLRKLAGEGVMRETARRMGLPLPDPRHDGDDYRLTLKGMALVVANRAAFWRHEEVALPISPGFDELAFGTALDAWSRTYRSTAWTTGAPATISRRGLTIIRSRSLPEAFDRTVTLPSSTPMESTFAGIGRAYGPLTARFVALQFEHPYGAISAWERS